MKFVLLIMILLIGCFASFAQDNCPEFDTLLKQANGLFTKGDYRNAFYKYNTARTCSPSRRKEVDDKIKQLFEEIEGQRVKAIDNEAKVKKINKINKELIAVKERENLMLLKDSIDFALNFIEKNAEFLDSTLEKNDKTRLLRHVDSLRRMDQGVFANHVAAGLSLFYQSKIYAKAFFDWLKYNLEVTSKPDFFENKSVAIYDIGYRAYDTYYYWALARLDQGLKFLPELSEKAYGHLFSNLTDSLKTQRKLLEENYWLPDTVIDLPFKDLTLYAQPSSDYQHFVWGGIGASELQEYKKLQLRFVNLSANNFALTIDSLVELAPAGKYYSVLTADANYRYMVVKQVDYSLKKNLVEFINRKDADPAVVKLIDRNGKVLKDLYNGDFFLSPNAKFLANWKTGDDELNLYNLKTQTNWKFPFSSPVYTMSFSSDSKTMIYYNDSTKLFYVLDITGNEPRLASSFSPATQTTSNIDFTGDNKFLRINTFDSVFLYDIEHKKILFGFDSSFVKNIVVAPNGEEALLICNRSYQYRGHLTYCVDMNLKIKDKLYSDCGNFFYTPDGKFIVGYDDYNVMRWQTDKTHVVKNEYRTCVDFKELIDKNAVPFKYFTTTNDGHQIELGARKFFNLGYYDTPDTLLANSYLRQSQVLFDRLSLGDAENFVQDRRPFFYDWSNFIRRRLGNRDYYHQFISQQAAVEIFDKLMKSQDGDYPMLLHYAANGNMLLNNLYDSLRIFNNNYIEQIKKEIAIRTKVFDKDPDNKDNIYYFTETIKRLSKVYDTLGWRYLIKNQYQDRLALFRAEEAYLGARLNVFPDSFGVKDKYVLALTQLAPSYLYVYANKPKENVKALDSAISYADRGISMATFKYDIATFLVVKARAYLLQENGLEKALELYGQVVKDYSELFTKETMLFQLKRLSEAGATTPNISRVEEFLDKK